MFRPYAVLLPLALCVIGLDALAQQGPSGTPLPVVGRSMVATRYGIVAASQPLAARAGVQILERGDNAIDAVIAAARGHELRVIGPRTGTFGYGQAVMSAPDGVHFGASEPRHDGAAIPEVPSVFGPVKPPSGR